jgi:hypothetical protein
MTGKGAKKTAAFTLFRNLEVDQPLKALHIGEDYL